MFHSLKTWLYENFRCYRHNLLHLRHFKLWYRDGLWYVREGDVTMRFSRYPFLAFYDIEGYLFDGKFKPRPGQTVIDAGGCFGEYAIYAAKKVGTSGRVLMLEPDPKNIEIAQAYLKLNGSPNNLEIVPAGLWSEKTILRFKTGQTHTSAVAGPDDHGPDVLELPMHSMKSLAEEMHLKRIDLVKMDIEGAEIQAVKGAEGLSLEVMPSYAIASYHVVDGKVTAEALTQQFKAMGYQSQTGNERHLTTWAWKD